MALTATIDRPAPLEAPLLTLFGPGHAENPFPLYARMRQLAPATKGKRFSNTP